MIIQRLYELAERENLLEDPAFETLPVPFVIHIGDQGQYLGVLDQRGEILIPSKKKDAPPKTKLGKGKELPVPKAHGNTANRGFARYFCDTLARVLPITGDEKSARSRDTFWQQLKQAAVETKDLALEAVVKFGDQLAADKELIERVRKDVEAQKPAAGDRCTFAWHPDGGASILLREPVRAWYRRFFATVSDERAEAGSQGFCQVTGQFGPLPTSHATKLGGVPGGIASGVSLVSYDKDAFESYGLDKAVNAGIGYRAADGCTRALTALLTNKLPDRPKTSFRLGGVVFLCWTRTPKDAIDHESIYAPTPERVVKLLTSAIAGKQHYGVRARDFYCLALSGNAARAIVRSYLELPIGEVQRHLAAWFRDLSIVGDFTGEVVNAFALSTLVEMTVRSGDDPPPDLSNAMVTAALTESPLPQSVLAACLRRIRVEAGAAQFSPARMGLIKLVVNRLPGTGDFKMTASLDPVAEQQSPGYACGRLLACLARCQSPKDFGASAQILERFFGSASAAPRAVFPILLRLNRHHIRKIRDELPGFAYNLEQDLEERLAPFRKPLGQNPDFPATLSLPDQGRFALGFYHQRADFRAASKERKAAELSSVDTE